MNAVDRGLELRSTEDAFKLGQQQGAHDQIKVAVGPSFEDLCRCAAWREQRRDEDVAVEDYASHSAARGVLLLDGDPHRFFLAHAGA